MIFISNGIQYYRENGKIKIKGQVDSPILVKFFIEDTGRGVSKHMPSRISTPFDRLGRENTEIIGTGIGLTNYKDLMDLIERRLWLGARREKGPV